MHRCKLTVIFFRRASQNISPLGERCTPREQTAHNHNVYHTLNYVRALVRSSFGSQSYGRYRETCGAIAARLRGLCAMNIVVARCGSVKSVVGHMHVTIVVLVFVISVDLHDIRSAQLNKPPSHQHQCSMYCVRIYSLRMCSVFLLITRAREPIAPGFALWCTMPREHTKAHQYLLSLPALRLRTTTQHSPQPNNDRRRPDK